MSSKGVKGISTMGKCTIKGCRVGKELKGFSMISSF